MLKTTLLFSFSAFFLLALMAEPAVAKLASTVQGLNLVNAHEVVPGLIYRGGQPGSQTGALKAFGITDVLIIKTDTKGEVVKEVESLDALGIPSLTLDVEWKNIPNEPKNCKRFIKALKFVRGVLQDPSRRLYFHCTMGEDRTGVLAGLIRMLQDGWSAEDAFQNEMCRHGYADGQDKPAKIAMDVKRGLSPTFGKLANAIESGAMSWENLSESACNASADPSHVDDFVCP